MKTSRKHHSTLYKFVMKHEGTIRRLDYLLDRLTAWVTVGLVVALLVVVTTKIYDYTRFGSLISDEATIEWLESADSNYHKEVKDELAQLIETKIGFAPDEVVFKIGGGNYQSMRYTCTVWYKLGGTWHKKEFSYNQIGKYDCELDSKLCDIYC